MYGLMGEIDGCTLTRNLSPINQVLIGSNIRYMYSKLINPISQGLNRESVLHVDGVSRVDSEHHIIELTMIFDWQVVMISGDVFGI